MNLHAVLICFNNWGLKHKPKHKSIKHTSSLGSLFIYFSFYQPAVNFPEGTIMWQEVAPASSWRPNENLGFQMSAHCVKCNVAWRTLVSTNKAFLTISSPYHNQTGSEWVLKLKFNRNIKRQANKLSRIIKNIWVLVSKHLVILRNKYKRMKVISCICIYTL